MARAAGGVAADRADGAHRRFSPVQGWILLGAAAAGGGLAIVDADLAAGLLHGGLIIAFFAASLTKLACALTPPPDRIEFDRDHDLALPSYTVLAPLYREAAVVGELVEALGQIDYPADRLQVLLIVESDDAETQAAIRSLPLPDFARMFVAPAGAPRTKPRACNLALEQASGMFVVVYDAEDRPHPDQLREAAARFAAAGPDLACLQAPLRIETDARFIPAQFALEYAIQFEVLLPALARWGLPFPLGGTSNHFRAAALRSVGGWDPYNVTEDADIGFHLAAHGYRLGVIGRPTFEPAPTRITDWLPQRARWVKGHMQTLAVHARGPAARRPRSLAALVLTLALSVLSSHAHGAIALWTALTALLIVAAGDPLVVPIQDLGLLMTGWAATAAAGLVGLRRAGAPIRARDFLGAIAYWPLQTLAALKAGHQLAREPYRWDKTPHAPRAGRALP